MKQRKFDGGSIHEDQRGEEERMAVPSEVTANWEYNTAVAPYPILNTSRLYKYIHMQILRGSDDMKLIMSKSWTLLFRSHGSTHL